MLEDVDVTDTCCVNVTHSRDARAKFESVDVTGCLAAVQHLLVDICQLDVAVNHFTAGNGHRRTCHVHNRLTWLSGDDDGSAPCSGSINRLS